MPLAFYFFDSCVLFRRVFLSHRLLNFNVSIFWFSVRFIFRVIGSPLLRYVYGHNYVQISKPKVFLLLQNFLTGLVPMMNGPFSYLFISLSLSLSLFLAISFQRLTHSGWRCVHCIHCAQNHIVLLSKRFFWCAGDHDLLFTLNIDRCCLPFNFHNAKNKSECRKNSIDLIKAIALPLPKSN